MYSDSIETLKTLADELAAARRWTEAAAVQRALGLMLATERPVIDDTPGDYSMATR